MGAAFEITDATNHVNQKFDTLDQPVSYKSHAEIIFFFISLLGSRGRIFFMKVTEQHRNQGSRVGFTCLILKNYVSSPGFVWNNVPYKWSSLKRENCREIDDRLFYVLRKWIMRGHLLSLFFFYFFSFKLIIIWIFWTEIIMEFWGIIFFIIYYISIEW